MNIPQKVKDMLENADGKSLATAGPAGLTVIPVSTIFVEGESIWLINYFMNRTVRNLEEKPEAVLACWKGLSGYQIEADVSYEEGGDRFEEAKRKVLEALPDRVVYGVLILTPRAIYDVSAGGDRSGTRVVKDGE